MGWMREEARKEEGVCRNVHHPAPPVRLSLSSSKLPGYASLSPPPPPPHRLPVAAHLPPGHCLGRLGRAGGVVYLGDAAVRGCGGGGGGGRRHAWRKTHQPPPRYDGISGRRIRPPRADDCHDLPRSHNLRPDIPKRGLRGTGPGVPRRRQRMQGRGKWPGASTTATPSPARVGRLPPLPPRPRRPVHRPPLHDLRPVRGRVRPPLPLGRE